MTDGRVYVIGTFDTKAEELSYVARLIRATGINVTTVDVGTTESSAEADIPAHDVASHHPEGAARVLEAGDRGKAGRVGW